MPKRILFFTETLGAGGAERQLIYLLTALDRSRFSPHVLSLYRYPLGTPFYAPSLASLGIPYNGLEVKGNARAKARGLLKYSRFMWKLRPDVVQAWLHTANLIARLARPFCPPHILVTSERSILSRRGLRSERLTHWLDNHLTVNSPHTYDQIMSEAHRSPEKLTLIHNAVPLEDFAISPDPSLRNRLFPNASFVIGMIGRIAREKDHSTFLSALHLTQQQWPERMAVFFLGEATELRTVEKIRKLIQEYHLKDLVHLLPSTTNVVPYYHAADIIVLPSLYEGFSNVILEAFAAGKPVIVSTGADGAHVVRSGQTGWRFPTQDATALAECLQASWSFPLDHLKEMGKHAQKCIDKYTIKQSVQAYATLYQSLLEKRPSE